MPPVNQGSKAGLITALIISVILLMVSVIMAITINTDLTKQTIVNNNLKKQYEKVARTDQLPEGGDVSLIDAAKEKLNLTGSPSTLDVALAEITRLTALIEGGAGSQNYANSEAKAADAVTRALVVLTNPTAAAPTSAPTGTAVAMPAGETLISVIEKLEQKLNQVASTDAKKQAQLDELSKSLETRVSAWNEQVKALADKVADSEKRATDAEKRATDSAAQYQSMQAKADESNKTTVDTTSKQVTEMQTALAQAKAETTKVQTQLTNVTGQLGNYRMPVKGAAVRQADGSIIRVPNSTSCYISLGQGDHLPAGTTFEVYDKADGVPALTADSLSENNMPIGKASLEVVKVGLNTSECRVIHAQPGRPLAEGDIIANLVYNRDTTFNFFVYGNFDVDGNGIATSQEGDVVKSLVTRWGGKVNDKISVSTDFVVLGKEPEVRPLTKEEQDDAILKDKFDKSVAAAKAYQDVINEAATYHIPILNQNRFMYYIGYYDLMKR